MSKVLSTIKDLVVTLLIAFVIAMVLKCFIVDSCKILSDSMVPTLNKGDRVLISRISYIIGEPKRGDVIIFEPPAEVDEGVDFIKRVIGLPGETVEVRDGVVYINNEPLSEDYISEPPNYDLGPISVPEGKYFVLGDNRNNSADAHIWLEIASDPFISEDSIDAKAVFQYFPFNEIGLIEK
ncbi:MAG: signal peptidase I [Bacillota bacterium]|nr:signal peptidase I [Bacillota bacterium]